ncbi:MAG: biotin--[acetyl-CoA-carboxylase] ligase [Oxalobacter sp.]|nr:biotin--[acetyl-CoA-carboxylase] ligase [Oxalobacter sp.]
MTEAISANRIAAGLDRQARKIAIEIIDETGSTNTDLLKRAFALSSPTMLLARRQTAGRGRGGKTWHSAPDASLTFSLAWPFLRPAAELAGLPLVIGVSLARSLRELGVLVTLKWPNDVLKDGKKLAGILVERSSEPNRQAPDKNWVIIGIGINLQLPDELETQISQPAAEALWLSNMDKNLLVATLLNQLVGTFTQFESDGLAAFVTSWNALHAYDRKKVIVFRDGQPKHSGMVAGIDEYGRLILEENGNRTAFSAGEVSLRQDNE